MKLNLNKVLARTLANYRQLKIEKGFVTTEEAINLHIRSDQVIALAKAMVEEINKEFAGPEREIKRG